MIAEPPTVRLELESRPETLTLVRGILGGIAELLAIDSEHSSRVSALDRSLRSRNRLLEVRNYDDHWCDAIERETAEPVGPVVHNDQVSAA